MSESGLIEVVGAVIVRGEGEVLCAQRSGQMRQAYMWEFPGGKREQGERPEACLVREIREELSCEIEVGAYITATIFAYEEQTIRLETYLARVLRGEPVPREHAQLLWLPVEGLEALRWAPADLPTVSWLQAQAEASPQWFAGHLGLQGKVDGTVG